MRPTRFIEGLGFLTGRTPMWWVGGAAILVVVVWALSGVMAVDSGQVALVYRFGEIVRSSGAGLHFRMPRPIEHDERIMVTEVRRVEPGSRRLLTGDSNLVQLDLVVQYTVSDPIAFTLSAADPEVVISSQVSAAATTVVASLDVDTLLTTGRSELQRRVLETAQANLDRIQLGVRLMAADIKELVPPPPVVDAFNDVSSARGDRETLALSAEAYESKLLPDMRGRGARQVEEAKATSSERLAQARSEIARYESLVGSWQDDRQATRVDLHSNAIEAIAPKVDVIVAPAGVEVVLPSSQVQP